ncbi:MAG TPA: peptide chain release factor N(5)-glutamine methyltransferase [Gammaproteobacteria bacterium]|nr:peptide chain release factor N(5)-glutamine methyltransferase [Gammaproteobacteria bacterium]
MLIPTVSQVLSSASQRLSFSQEAPRLDAEVLVAHALDYSRTQLYLYSDKRLTEADCLAIDALVDRRCNGEPIAYIVGGKEFWSLNFKVTPDTLIPRPETEHLVELALARIPEDEAWQIVDLGTGSGAIAIAIANERPACQLLAIDKSEAALMVARDNAETLGVKNVCFRKSDWFAALNAALFHMVVSNPPYIARQDKHLTRGDVASEPKNALVAGVDGLDDVRKIIKQAKAHLLPEGYLLLEHGWNQAADVKAIFEEASYKDICTHKDLAGLARISQGAWGL